MNCEIIIAVRGEFPANLQHTISSIRATKGKIDPRIRIVCDGEETNPPAPSTSDVTVDIPWVSPRGCGAARHYGITQSKADVVVLIDGHMDFPAGWLDKIMTHHRRNKRDVCCCQMVSLSNRFEPLDDRVMTGAFLALKKAERAPGSSVDYHAIKGTWNPPHATPGTVGCIMGACYSFRRSWYQQMGEPLELCDEWGQDEELLSLGSMLCGGRVICLPVVIGHMYGAPSVNRENQRPEAVARRIASRFAVIAALPNGPHDDLSEWIRQRPRDYAAINQLIAPARAAKAEYLAGLWGQSGIHPLTLMRPCTEDESKQAMGFRVAEAAGQPVAERARVIVPEYRETAVQPPVQSCKLCGYPVNDNWRSAANYPGYRKCPKCNHKQQVRR